MAAGERSADSHEIGLTSREFPSVTRSCLGQKRWRGTTACVRYDAVQLASALTWRDSIGQDVVFATFDRQLWEATPRAGLQAWPGKLARH